MCTIQMTWHESVASVLRLRGEWDQLLDSWDVDCVFLRWDWIRVWLRVYGRDAHLLVGIAIDGEETVGIAPFVIAVERILPLGPRVRCVRLLGSGILCPDHLLLPVAPGREDDFADALVASLYARKKEWDRIELLDLLGAHAAWRSFGRAIEASGHAVLVRKRTHCPYVPLPASFDEYLGTLGAMTRRTIRHGMRRLDSNLKVQFMTPATIPDVDRLMAHLEDLHGRVWRARGHAGVFSDRNFRLFHRLHARCALRKDRLWLMGMCTQDREIAVLLGFLSRRGLHAYQLGHDPDLKMYSLGTMMVTSCIARAIKLGLSEMDFLRGQGAYKMHLARQERRGHDLIVHRGTAADVAADATAWIRGRISRIVGAVLGKRGKNWLKGRFSIR